MKYYPRYLKLKDLLLKKSYFLFGPRQTGKSSLIRYQLSEYQMYNLLDSETLLELSRRPKTIREQFKGSKKKDSEKKIIVIDEIQKLPNLLDEVHLMIEEYGVNFLLTGSSARKLRQGGVNLLGGRARSMSFFPFTFAELGKKFNLKKILNYGTLPSVYFSDEPELDLRSYAGNYLKEEVISEALVRNIEAFSRFLEIASLNNAKILNYTNTGNDAQVPTSTVVEYYEILKDTLILSFLPAWKESKKRKPITTAKSYFFDCGVLRTIQKRGELSQNTEAWGEALETFLFNEIKAYLAYNNKEGLHYWRSTSGFEVDFIICEKIAVELKSANNFQDRYLKGLKALREEDIIERYILITEVEEVRIVDKIEVMNLKHFLELLWNNELVY